MSKIEDVAEARKQVAQTIYKRRFPVNSDLGETLDDANDATYEWCMDIAEAAIEAALSAIVPEGSVVVPREASDAMKSAGAGHVNSCPCMLTFDLLSDAEFVWDAMIEAFEGAV